MPYFILQQCILNNIFNYCNFKMSRNIIYFQIHDWKFSIIVTLSTKIQTHHLVDEGFVSMMCKIECKI